MIIFLFYQEYNLYKQNFQNYKIFLNLKSVGFWIYEDGQVFCVIDPNPISKHYNKRHSWVIPKNPYSRVFFLYALPQSASLIGDPIPNNHKKRWRWYIHCNDPNPYPFKMRNIFFFFFKSCGNLPRDPGSSQFHFPLDSSTTTNEVATIIHMNQLQLFY